MAEVWLSANRRVLWFGALLPALVACFALAVCTGQFRVDESGTARAVGGGILLISLAALANLAWQARRPRLAYEAGKMLVYLRSAAPIRVPIDVVEGFLLGQGPSLLPSKRRPDMQASTVVVRLTERAEEWAQLDVKPALGYWCGHYITIRGAWCEPLSVDLVNRLNARLAEVKRQLRDAQVAS